jgi:large subunit ribosomal protein L17e
MGKYSVEVADPKTVAKAKASDVRIHFKNAVEVVAAVKGMTLVRAKAYLNNVLEKKEAIPYKHFTGGRGRHAQSKNLKAPGSLVGWPKNAVKAVLNLLKNAEANAESKTLDASKLTIAHAQANQAPKGRRRTYRAHGRVNAYMSVPAHLELILKEQAKAVPKAAESQEPKLFKRKLAARFRVKEAGGH